MKKRTKTKKSKAIASPTKKVVRTKKYEAHYLALVLIAFMLLEGFLVTSTHAQDWNRGVGVLDMSAPVAETVSDVATMFSPMSDAIAGVNQFYQLSATAMTEMLDLSNNDPVAEVRVFTDGVYEFYQQASTELASLLDVSSVSSWPASIAGASITAQ